MERENPTKSIGNCSSGEQAKEEMAYLNAVGNSDGAITNEKEEEVDNISVIRGRIQELAANIGTFEETCRNQPGSGWRIVCSSRSVCDQLRQYNSILEEIGEDSKFVHDRLEELSQELEITRSELKSYRKQTLERLDEDGKNTTDEKRGIEAAADVSSRSCGESASEREENTIKDPQKTTEMIIIPQQDAMERLDGLSHYPSPTSDAAALEFLENYDPVNPIFHSGRQPSIKMKHEDEERKRLEEELIRVEKEMKYDYYFLKQVAAGDLKTSLQWLHDLKQQASETENIVKDELKKLKDAHDMITYLEYRNEEGRRKLPELRQNAPRSEEEPNSVKEDTNMPVKEEWPELQSSLPCIDKEIINKARAKTVIGIGSSNSNQETQSSLQLSEQEKKPQNNRGNLEKAQKLARDLTEENKFPKLVV